MVGGPSEVYASSGAAVFCAGMNPPSLKDLLRGCLLVAFFEKPPVLPWTLSFFLKSTRPSLPLKKAPPLISVFSNSLYDPFGSPCRGQKPQGRRGNRPTRCFFSKTYPSFLTLKEGSTSLSKPLPSQKGKDVPTALLGAQTATLYGWRTIRGLRQQQSCRFLCGDEPAFTQGFAKGLFARCFFRKPTSPSLTLSLF